MTWEQKLTRMPAYADIREVPHRVKVSWILFGVLSFREADACMLRSCYTVPIASRTDCKSRLRERIHDSITSPVL